MAANVRTLRVSATTKLPTSKHRPNRACQGYSRQEQGMEQELWPLSSNPKLPHANAKIAQARLPRHIAHKFPFERRPRHWILRNETQVGIIRRSGVTMMRQMIGSIIGQRQINWRSGKRPKSAHISARRISSARSALLRQSEIFMVCTLPCDAVGKTSLHSHFSTLFTIPYLPPS